MKKVSIEDVLASWTGINDPSQLKSDIIGAMEEWADRCMGRYPTGDDLKITNYVFEQEIDPNSGMINDRMQVFVNGKLTYEQDGRLTDTHAECIEEYDDFILGRNLC